MNSENKICQNCRGKFIVDDQDFKFYEKVGVPPPTWCPECRLIRRFAWRNQHSLYSRNCDKCGKSIISVYSKDKDVKVWCSPCWWKDDWDGLEYGVDFDPKKPFLTQVRELLLRVPVMNLFGLYTSLVNSDYTNMVSFLKNCYLVTHSDYSENCAYAEFTDNTRDSFDTLIMNKCELCYECVNCVKCYRAFFSVDCENCANVYFSRNCIDASDCFGCVNLRHKQYHIFNKPYTKEGYEKALRELGVDSFSSIQKLKEKAHKFWTQFPQKFSHERHNQNVSGDYIYNSKNTLNSYIAADMEDSRYCAFITPGGSKDNWDFTHYGVKAELTYDSLQVGNQTSRVLFSWFIITGCRDVEYSMFQVGCANIFGSVGLKKRKYCILNKQYTKEEYEKQVLRIKEHINTIPYVDKNGRTYTYGEFFPPELSPFCYNETTAQEFFPLTKDEALKRGYNWKEKEISERATTLSRQDLPDNIKDASDSITNEIISCAHEGTCNEQCTQAFRIIPQELKFYRQMNLPLPRLCPNCRHYERLPFRNPPILHHRKCMCNGGIRVKGLGYSYQNTIAHFHGDKPCPNEFETSYSPERQEIVYCEKCYIAEVA